MNQGLRKKIYKIPMLYYFCQKYVESKNAHFYKSLCKKTDNIAKIKSLKNKHDGERCFIVGNGPSLTMSDLELIKNEDCFAANLIFRIFDKTNWRPKYYFILDRYADTGDALDSIQIDHMFIGDYYWRVRGVNNSNALCVHSVRSYTGEKIGFSEEISDVIIAHYTVTYAMIQAAVYMGYKEIYLLGMDHSYALTYDSKGNVTEDKTVTSHIFEDKNPNEVIANIEGMNKAYIGARDYAICHDIKIVNVTRGGKLEWFPRMRLEEVL